MQPLRKRLKAFRASTTRPPLPLPANPRAIDLRGLHKLLVGGLSSICIITAMDLLPICTPAISATRSASATAPRDLYGQFVDEAARRFGIPDTWVRAVMATESGGNARVVSPKGAMGLMQIMPETWADLRDRYSFGADPFDPHDNILAGAAYLREMFDRFGQSGFLAAYNAGPARVQRYLASLKTLPEETLRYVAKIEKALPALSAVDDSTTAIRGPDGQNASLFADVSAAPSPPAVAPSANVASGVVAASGFALAPQSAGLFVALEAAGR